MKKANLKIWTGSCWQSIFPVTNTDQVKHAITGKSLTTILQDASLAPNVLQEAEKYTDKAIKETTEAFAEELSKTEQQLKDYTDEQIASFSLYNVVTELPSVGYPNKIYLVPRSETEDDNRYDEYLWVNDSWEYQGTKTIKIDLTDYQTKKDAAAYKTYVDENFVHNAPAMADPSGRKVAYGADKNGNIQYFPVGSGAGCIPQTNGYGLLLNSWEVFAYAGDDNTLTPKKYVDEINDKLLREISLLSYVQFLSGLQYIQPISEAYNERITANGESILDNQGNGSTARLLTVDGDTQKTKNLFNFEDIEATEKVDDGNGVIQITGSNWYYSFGKLPKGDYTVSVEDYYPTTPYDFTISIAVFQGSEALPFLVVNGYPYTGTFTLSEDTEIRLIGTIPTSGGTVILNRFQLEKGSVATEYAQYFDGLKNATFQGIISKTADGTKESVLSLPSAIDCGLGTTIDFENQKIIETYGEYTFDGSETIRLNGAYGDNGYYSYILHGAFTMKKGSAQDGVCDRYPTDKTMWFTTTQDCIRFGQVNGAVYLILSKDLTEDEVKALINGMKIRYPLKTPIETPFTEEQKAVGNEYTAWKNGTEDVQGNANSSYGVYPTLTQEYVTVIDIQDTIQDSIEESVDSSIRQALQGEY